MIYCQFRFVTAKDLKQHKQDCNHKRKKKNKSAEVIVPPPQEQVAPLEVIAPRDQLPAVEPALPEQRVHAPQVLVNAMEIEEVAVAPRPRESRRAPIQSLKDQFLEFTHSILGKVEHFILTPEQGSKAIVKFISAKSHVRSNDVEDSAKSYARQISRCETEDKKIELLREMVSSFDKINWD
jgi:hypothetical protein